MDIEQLKAGPRVRAKLYLDGSVSVIRYSVSEVDGRLSLKKEYLSDLGEWVLFLDNEELLQLPKKLSEVVRETEDPLIGDLNITA